LSILHGFASLELISTKPCRPFDQTRDGINIGEAAGFALLMRAEHMPECDLSLAGFGESSDAFHMAQPHPQGKGAASAMNRALISSGLVPEQIDYINLHGTASRANDLAETKAVASIFSQGTQVSSTKGWTGHTLGAAGITGVVIALESLRTGVLPGTLHCDNPDKDLAFPVLQHSVQTKPQHVMANSLGFGGNNCALVFSKGAATTLGEVATPKPELIPSRERRRSSTLVKLSVEVASQACDMADISPADAQCVFTSGIGDAELTDYMCRVLAGPDKLLSPTKFHNSVHNAAVGCWSISTRCEQPATFISSMQSSFSMGLMEAMVQVTAENVPVLLVVSDIPMPQPMKCMHPIEQLFGAAFLLTPEEATNYTSTDPELPTVLSLSLTSDPGVWPELLMPPLKPLYSVSPSARGLCLLQALCSTQLQRMTLPLSEGLAAQVTLTNSRTTA